MAKRTPFIPEISEREKLAHDLYHRQKMTDAEVGMALKCSRVWANTLRRRYEKKIVQVKVALHEVSQN